jgi:hypothetical protein
LDGGHFGVAEERLICFRGGVDGLLLAVVLLLLLM